MTDLSSVRRDFVVSDSMAYWGTIIFIISESALFAFLFFSYYYFAIQPRQVPWPPNGLPALILPGAGALVLLASAPVAWYAERATKRGERMPQLLALSAVFIMGVAYMVIQYFDWRNKPFTFQDSYGSFYYTITGFHVAHTLMGVLVFLALIVWSFRGDVGRFNSNPVTIGAIYWYFLAAIVVAVYFTLSLTPYLGLRHV